MQTDCQLMCYTLQKTKIVNTYHCKEIQRIKSKKFLLQIKHVFDKQLFAQLMQEGFAKRCNRHRHSMQRLGSRDIDKFLSQIKCNG